MYYSYYPILPSLGISITSVVSGLVCALLNLTTLRAGLRKMLIPELVFGTLALIVSVLQTICPLLAWCYRFDAIGIFKLLLGLQGFLIFLLALVGMIRTINDQEVSWKEIWMMLLATALMIIPWLMGMHTETV